MTSAAPHGSCRAVPRPALKLQRFSEQSREAEPSRGTVQVDYSLCAGNFRSSYFDSEFNVQVGNLSFYTTEEQIYELFSKCTSPEEGGGVKRIIMGLDRNTK